MRFVTQLPHPGCRITIHHMNNKYLVKFETKALEQVYKFEELEISTDEDFKQILTESFIEGVMKRFIAMDHDFNSLTAVR